MEPHGTSSRDGSKEMKSHEVFIRENVEALMQTNVVYSFPIVTGAPSFIAFLRAEKGKKPERRGKSVARTKD